MPVYLDKSEPVFQEPAFTEPSLDDIDLDSLLISGSGSLPTATYNASNRETISYAKNESQPTVQKYPPAEATPTQTTSSPFTAATSSPFAATTSSPFNAFSNSKADSAQQPTPSQAQGRNVTAGNSSVVQEQAATRERAQTRLAVAAQPPEKNVVNLATLITLTAELVLASITTNFTPLQLTALSEATNKLAQYLPPAAGKYAAAHSLFSFTCRQCAHCITKSFNANFPNDGSQTYKTP